MVRSLVTRIQRLWKLLQQGWQHELALVALASFCFFALQMLLISGLRFSTTYVQAQLMLALGLLGILLGGVLAARVPDSELSVWLHRWVRLFPLLPLFGLFGVIISFAYPIASMVLLTVVFVPLGAVLTGLYRRYSPWQLYAVELLSATAGLLAVVLWLPPLREENALLVLAAAAGVVLLFRPDVVPARPIRLLLGCFVLSVLVFVSINRELPYLNLALHTWCDVERVHEISGNKIMCLDELGTSYRLLDSFGSVVDRIDIVDPEHMRDYYGVGYSGTRNDLLLPYSPEQYQFDARIPSGIVASPTTLILGAGAEGVVKVAKSLPASEITVVELNPAVLQVWDASLPYHEYAHAPLSDTRIYQDDGRAFLRHQGGVYDIITLMNTHRAVQTTHFGQPDFLHTKEAFQEYLDALTEVGFLTIEEPSYHNAADGEIARRISTIQAALRERGSSDPNQHLVVYQWVAIDKDDSFAESYGLVYTQILLKRTPWQPGELAAFREWAAASQDTSRFLRPTSMAFYRPVWYPDTGLQPTLASSSPIQATLTKPESHPILTDTTPFARTIAPVDQRLLAGVLAVMTLVLLCSSWLVYQQSGRVSLRWLGYFTLLGIGYMFVEVFLLQWWQLYLGSVTLALGITLGGLFVAGAAASLFTWSRLRLTTGRLWLALALVALLLLAGYHLPLDAVSYWTRLVTATLLTVGVGGILAIFFPLGVARLPVGLRSQVATLVGLNTVSLAVAVPIALLLAAGYGFAVLLIIAGLAYLLALILLSNAIE